MDIGHIRIDSRCATSLLGHYVALKWHLEERGHLNRHLLSFSQ